MIFRLALAAIFTAIIAFAGLNAPRAQFNGCKAGFCSPPVSGCSATLEIDPNGSAIASSSFVTNPSVTISTTNTNDVILAFQRHNATGLVDALPTSAHLTFNWAPGFASSLPSGQSFSIAYAIAASALSSEAITTTLGGTSGVLTIVAVSGANTSGGTGLSGTFDSNAAITSSTPITFPSTGNTVSAPEIIFAFVGNTVGGADSGGWVLVTNANFTAGEYITEPSTGSFSAALGSQAQSATATGIRRSC